MKVGIIGAGTMGSGIAQAFAMTDGYEVCRCICWSNVMGFFNSRFLINVGIKYKDSFLL